MIKFICDKCHCQVNMTVMPFRHKAVILEGVHRREYDLCKKCFYEVQEFIQGQTERDE